MCKTVRAIRANQWFPFGATWRLLSQLSPFCWQPQSPCRQGEGWKDLHSCVPEQKQRWANIGDDFRLLILHHHHHHHHHYLLLLFTFFRCFAVKKSSSSNGVVLDRTWCHFTLPQPVLRYRWRWSPRWISFRCSKILWLCLCLNELMY